MVMGGLQSSPWLFPQGFPQAWQWLFTVNMQPAEPCLALMQRLANALCLVVLIARIFGILAAGGLDLVRNH